MPSLGLNVTSSFIALLYPCLFLQAVKVNLHVECKCHGVSGSCTMKTCWKTLPAFRQIGDSLMRKYSRARAVLAVEVGSRPGRRSKNLQLVLRRLPVWSHQLLEKKRTPRRSDLVFLQESPNYCERDHATGSMGTVGRHCNRTSRGEISGSQAHVITFL
jgi:wingless-type MMTV integration site family protein 7